MIRPAAVLLAALLLPACADSGVGGQPVQSVPYANAAVQVAETAAAATQQAYSMSYSSTVSAANGVATNEAAKVTAVALATATEVAALNSAAAIGVMTREAIEAQTLQAEATATAVHLQWLIDYDARKAVNQQRTAEFWHWGRAIFLVLLAAAGWSALRWFIPAIYEWMVPSIRDNDGNTLAFRKGYTTQPIIPAPVPIDDFKEPEIGEHFETEVHTANANFTIKSPTPAGFTTWLATVLDNSRCEFSNNERKARGWHIEYYGDMILKMKTAKWLHPNQDGRGVYTMTDYGKAQAREWLAGK